MDITGDSQLQLTQAMMLKRSVSVPHIVAAPGVTEATLTSDGNAGQTAANSDPAAAVTIATTTAITAASAEPSVAPTETTAAAAAAHTQPLAGLISAAIQHQPMMTRAAAAGLITPTPVARQSPAVSGIFMTQQHSHSLRTQKSSPSLPSAVASSITFGGGGSGSAGPASRCNSPTPGSGSGSCSSSPSGGSSPLLNCFGAHRTRRYSTSFSPLAGGSNAGNVAGGGGGGGGGSVGMGAAAAMAGGGILRLTPRVSQLRQEECADVSNSREVSHERDVHTALQISQSWEDLSLDASDSLSVRSGGGGSSHGGDGNGGSGSGSGGAGGAGSGGDLSNPLHVSTLGLLGLPHCSSPSPTSSRTPIRLPPYGLSPSPTRRTFATRRSMSPIAMRQSSLGPVKRKFEMDESALYASSPPPFKKFFQERGNSPCSSGASPSHHHPYAHHPYSLGTSIYNHSTQYTCPSPDSTESSSGASGSGGGGGGRSTPKLFMSKLCTNSSSSFSSASSPSTTSAPSPSMEVPIDLHPHLQQLQQHEPMQTNASEAEADQSVADGDTVMKSVEPAAGERMQSSAAAAEAPSSNSALAMADSSSSSGCSADRVLVDADCAMMVSTSSAATATTTLSNATSGTMAADAASI